jgi:SAM-dependent methyltransferase
MNPKTNVTRESAGVDQEQMDRLCMVIGGHIFFQTLSAAVELGLFSLLKKHGPLERAEIAHRLNIEQKPARILLLGCTALGLVQKNGLTYSNSGISDSYLVSDSPHSLVSIVRWQHHINYRPMYRFCDALRANRNVGLDELPGDGDTLYARLAHNPNLEKVFHDAMRSWCVQTSAELVECVDLSRVRHIVDVGGGDGTNVIAFAKRYPHLRGTVFDSAAIVEIARKEIASAGLGKRLHAVSGDCFKDDFPDDIDCILFAHFLPIWSEDENRKLLRKAFEALPAGGLVIVQDMLQFDDETGPLTAALGSPYFLTLASGRGMKYTWRECESWMVGAGLHVKKHELPRDHGVFIGTKPPCSDADTE